MEDASTIGINTFAYAPYNGEDIRVRINSIISDVSYPDNTVNYGNGDTARIKTLGVNEKSVKGTNWVYNICTKLQS